MFIAKSYYAGLICLCLFFAKALSDGGSKRINTVGMGCDPTTVVTDDQCSSNEYCDASNPTTNSTCQCLPSYVNDNGSCVQPQTTPSYSSLVDNQGNGSLVAGILIPLILITVVICSVYIGKRFELGKWLRQRLNQRNRNYDEFMIGQEDDDDPPLA